MEDGKWIKRDREWCAVPMNREREDCTPYENRKKAKHEKSRFIVNNRDKIVFRIVPNFRGNRALSCFIVAKTRNPFLGGVNATMQDRQICFSSTALLLPSSALD